MKKYGQHSERVRRRLSFWADPIWTLPVAFAGFGVLVFLLGLIAFSI